MNDIPIVLETKGHAALKNGEPGVTRTPADKVRNIREAYATGQCPNIIAQQNDVSRATVIRYTRDIDPPKPKPKLAAARITELMRGW